MAGLVQLKGGSPFVFNRTTVNPAAVEEWTWREGPASRLWFRNTVDTGTGTILLSFTRSDAEASPAIGVTVATGEIFELDTEIGGFYTQSAAAESFEAVVIRRRG